MATQMIKAYIGDKPVMVPKGEYIPGASPVLEKGVTLDAEAAQAPMIDAFIGDKAVKVPKGFTVKGASLERKSAADVAADPNNVNPIHAEIDSWGLDPALTAIMKSASDNPNFTMDNNQPTDAEVAEIFKQHLIEAEADMAPYFDKVQSQDLEDLKTAMSDLRMSTERYKQQEQLDYSQKLAQTKQSIRSRGMTFSGASRKQLGQEGALNSAGVEGTMPQDRRFGWEEYSAKVQEAARDAGLAAERQYGSRAVGGVQDQFGNFANPYADASPDNLNYNGSRTSPLYLSKRLENGRPQEGYIRSQDQTQYAEGTNRRFLAQSQLDRQAAIRRRAQDAMNYGTN